METIISFVLKAGWRNPASVFCHPNSIFSPNSTFSFHSVLLSLVLGRLLFPKKWSADLDKDDLLVVRTPSPERPKNLRSLQTAPSPRETEDAGFYLSTIDVTHDPLQSR